MEEMRGRKGEREKRRFISVHLCVFSVELCASSSKAWPVY
jgi:hypothetical protein